MKFDDKIATGPIFKYKAGRREQWANGVRNYFVGRCRDAAVFLKWCDDHQMSPIEPDSIRDAHGLAMMDVCPAVLSAKMWA